MNCLACNVVSKGNNIELEERMFGSGEVFDYQICDSCKTIQICKVPENLGSYYPDDYYAFEGARLLGLPRLVKNPRLWVRAQRRASEVGVGGVAGAVASTLLGPLGTWGVHERYTKEWFAGLQEPTEAKILDFGCGSGLLLARLREAGFKHLVGVDPYLPEEVSVNGLSLEKGDESFAATKGSFDLIMLHHVLEHVSSPVEVLRTLSASLADNGVILVRIPVSGTYAWRRYGADWIQLDPPRHLVIPTQRGMVAIANRAGLQVDRTVYDSTSFQFWASEKVQIGIPLADSNNHGTKSKQPLFTPTQKKGFEEAANRLNAIRDGDQAAFFLSRPTS